MNPTPSIDQLIAIVPPGRWGVAVSGGADSVALLRLVCDRPDIQPHVIHLDHETRDGASAADAAFVADLANQLQIPISSACRSEIAVHHPSISPRLCRGSHAAHVVNKNIGDADPSKDQQPPQSGGLMERAPLIRNLSTAYRASRLAWFSIVVHQHNLNGILLAHHADDQAETIAQQLLRGRRPAALAGMATNASVDGIRLLRPLLTISRATLRQYLIAIGQPWIEDASNISSAYQRNRIRQWLATESNVRESLLALGECSASLGQWLTDAAPQLAEAFDTRALAILPLPLARQSARQWLLERGASGDDLADAVCDRLIEMASDFSSPPRLDFPGAIHVRRRGGQISTSAPAGFPGTHGMD